MVWKISTKDEANLDRYEGVPRFYHKTMVPFSKGQALIYIMNNGFPAENPSTAYLKTVQNGYAAFGMDINYLMDALVDTWEERQKEEDTTPC